jgi:hypothetical protein
MLIAAERPLTLEALDFCLKQFGYRFGIAGLRNALQRSYNMTRTNAGEYRCTRGVQAEYELRSELLIVPARQRQEWEELKASLARRINKALSLRSQRLATALETSFHGINWES